MVELQISRCGRGDLDLVLALDRSASLEWPVTDDHFTGSAFLGGEGVFDAEGQSVSAQSGWRWWKLDLHRKAQTIHSRGKSVPVYFVTTGVRHRNQVPGIEGVHYVAVSRSGCAASARRISYRRADHIRSDPNDVK